MKRLAGALILGVALMLVSTVVSAGERLQLKGKVGDYPIGLQLSLRDARVVEGGHYYYSKHLTDIPLTGRSDGEALTLTGGDGGVFRLRFVTKGAAGGVAGFERFDSLCGTWSRGDVSLPVELRLDWMRWGVGARLYEDVTAASDAEFEGRVRAFVTAVRRGDGASAATFVSYPMTVNRPDSRSPLAIRTKAELVKRWDVVFTPALLKGMDAATPRDLFVRDGLAMLGEGQIWFDARGAKVVNLG